MVPWGSWQLTQSAKCGAASRPADTLLRFLSKNMNGTIYELARETLLPNEYWTFDKLIILDATTEKLVAKTDATAATTEPSFDSAFADAT